MKPKRNRTKNLLTTMVSLIVMFLFAELILRLIGFETWQTPPVSAMPGLHSTSSELGWEPIAGTYDIPVAHSASERVKITINEKGERITSNQVPSSDKEEVLFIGGSFTFGWAINDEETFAWKLQQQHPELNIRNLGVSAYGTYQSLLRLEKALKTKKPLAVIYGYLPQHTGRNVASNAWLEAVTRYNGKDLAGIPYSSLGDEGNLVRHQQARLTEFPLNESSVFINTLQRVYNKQRAKRRSQQKVEVTAEIIRTINRLCRENDVLFYCITLKEESDQLQGSLASLSLENIPFTNCGVENKPELIVPEDGHPNGRANTLFAQCIEEKVFKAYNLSQKGQGLDKAVQGSLKP